MRQLLLLAVLACGTPAATTAPTPTPPSPTPATADGDTNEDVIGLPPDAKAVAILRGADAPLATTLDGTGTSDADGDLDALTWDFGDGSPPATGAKVDHVFAGSGHYAVKLTATDKSGNRATTTVSLDIAQGACPAFQEGVVVGKIDDDDVKEASGLAASRRNAGILWVHNDSGDVARFFAVGAKDAHVVRTIAVTGANAIDWEDVAAAKDADGKAWVYLADIGDNDEQRDHVTIYEVAEPDLADASVTSVTAEAIDLKYPDHAHNAETLLADPVTGDLYVVTKEKSGKDGVYRAHDGKLEQVASVDVGGLLTAGDVSPDGAWILLRTYDKAMLYRRGATFADSFAGAPCAVPAALEKQGEAIAFSADGKSYFTTTEGKKPPIRRYDLVPPKADD